MTVIFPALLLYIWCALGIYGMYRIEHFERRSFADVFSIPEYRQKYDLLQGQKNPASYGISNFKTVHYQSQPEGLNLEAWYIPAQITNTRDCVLLTHGRGPNRLKTMKYAGLLRELGLLRDHCVLIVDLRNSGNSQESSTALGWGFADDIVSSLEYLNREHRHDRFIIYSFSTSAMATGLVFYRSDLQKRLQASNLAIKGLVLDSPLANIEKNYYHKARKQFGLPDFLMAGGIVFFGWHQPFAIDDLRLSHLYPHYRHLPVLIFQSRADTTTPYEIFASEFAAISDTSNIDLQLFDKANHVRIYQNPLYQDTYKQSLKVFLQKVRSGSS